MLQYKIIADIPEPFRDIDIVWGAPKLTLRTLDFVRLLMLQQLMEYILHQYSQEPMAKASEAENLSSDLVRLIVEPIHQHFNEMNSAFKGGNLEKFVALESQSLPIPIMSIVACRDRLLKLVSPGFRNMYLDSEANHITKIFQQDEAKMH